MTDLQMLQNNNNFDKTNKIDNISLDGTHLDELRQIAMNMPTNRDTNFNNLITPKINFDKNFNGNPNILNNQNNQNNQNMQNMQNNQNILNTKNILNNNQNNNSNNKDFIKSITKEIINNLKENNISFDGDTNRSQKSNKSNYYDDSESSESIDKYLEKDSDFNSNIKKNKYSKDCKDNKENIKNVIKENFEDMVESNSPLKNSKGFMNYIFDDCFNFKDFLLLFSIYFILSQDMIKDVFSQYFTSINPDDYGRVGAKGVIIYGLILTILFMVSRKFI